MAGVRVAKCERAGAGALGPWDVLFDLLLKSRWKVEDNLPKSFVLMKVTGHGSVGKNKKK